MKVLRLSDEDYEALLGALESAQGNANAVAYEFGGTDEDEKEAKRLHDLLKPLEYPIEPHTLLDERMMALNEMMALARIAGIPVTLTTNKSFTGETAELNAHYEQPNYFAAAKNFGD